MGLACNCMQIHEDTFEIKTKETKNRKKPQPDSIRLSNEVINIQAETHTRLPAQRTRVTYAHGGALFALSQTCWK